MEDIERELKEAYNKYIDSLINYLTQWNKEQVNNDLKENNATKYILDNHFSVGFRNSLELVKAGNIEKLLNKKVI